MNKLDRLYDFIDLIPGRFNLYIVDFLLIVVFVWIFRLLSLIQISEESAPFESEFLNKLLVASIFGLFFVMLFRLLDDVNLGCIPSIVKILIVGPASFWLVAKIVTLIFPSWLTITSVLWLNYMMGSSIIITRIIFIESTGFYLEQYSTHPE